MINHKVRTDVITGEEITESKYELNYYQYARPDIDVDVKANNEEMIYKRILKDFITSESNVKNYFVVLLANRIFRSIRGIDVDPILIRDMIIEEMEDMIK